MPKDFLIVARGTKDRVKCGLGAPANRDRLAFPIRFKAFIRLLVANHSAVDDCLDIMESFSIGTDFALITRDPQMDEVTLVVDAMERESISDNLAANDLASPLLLGPRPLEHASDIAVNAGNHMQLRPLKADFRIQSLHLVDA